ncbi:MAG: hypothetical protein HY738_11760 [Bacteroidia bacterium]|nr:hypothetical protein [Bacteroidia bacterium]
MKKELISVLLEKFENACYIYQGIECWSARELQQIFNYTDWRNFLKVIDKAQNSCINAGVTVSDHFVEINKMIELAKGAQQITREHVDNNLAVRKILNERGVKPEALPPAEDVKKVQRRLEGEEKKY